ncbi:hypothetical protein GGS23DRAFT_577422 [Durotheca rogersii]|uniref:uncharacterized protein n=1 Tax=Durotheca rogersii TaxID=419775 RepID=UPI00221F278E|nr:uncharacterized protein GGS23DRAFT_577422 [Durotheca rogersii]KAI5861163.1 hypothetical protein GGS23DRAFT_577422 [Durotheca rogersii]
MQPSQPAAAVPFTIDGVQPGMLAFPDSPDLYRIRLQPAQAAAAGTAIKYLVAPNSSKVFTGPDAHIRRYDNLAFDKVPPGDWVVGRLVVAEEGGDDSRGGKLRLASTEADAVDALEGLGLYSAGPAWCSTAVEEGDCQDAPDSPRWTTVVDAAGKEISVPKPTDLQCMGYVSASIIAAPTRDVTDAKEVVRVSDWLPGHWVGIRNEARTYEIIQSRDPGLAPRFLGHITENRSRVVGFLLERIPDAREAGPADLEKCKTALARLHALGIAKGQLSRHSFLVRHDGSVLIQGPFTGPPEEVGDISEAMKTEMESLEKVLALSPSTFEAQSARMRSLIDPQRIELLGEFEKAHGFVVPFVYWQESREGGGRITLTVEQHGVLAKECRENGFRWTKELQEQAERRFGPSVEAV